MKKLLTLFLSLFTLVDLAQVQQPDVLSVHVYEGSCSLSPNVCPQKDGGFIFNIYAASNGIGTIDSLCGLSGDRTIFIKYNSDASILEWIKCYAGNSHDSSFEFMFSTTDGGYILGGIGNGASYKFLVHKENATGTLLWTKSYGDSASAIVRGMIATEDAGYIMAGEINYTDTDFPTHYGSFMNADIGVLKFDSLGNKVWSKVIGGTGDERCRAVINGPNNGCYVIGNTPSNDYDCIGNHGGSSGSTDMYVARLDNNGNILWHHDLGGTGYDGGDGGYPDGNGGIIVTGSSGSNDGDVTHQINTGGYNIWVVDLDSNNNIIWNNCFGGGGQEFSTSVCKAVDGTIWIAGQSEIKGGEVDTAYGGEDAWMVHADNTGNFMSAKVLGSHRQDVGEMIYPLSNGNIIAGGYYDTTGGVFPLISWSGGGTFLTVFGPWPESVQQINAINDTVSIYPNPTNNILTVEAKERDNYTVNVTDILGRTIYTTSLMDKIQIPVNDWQAGMYYVQVVSENGFKNVQKLMVK